MRADFGGKGHHLGQLAKDMVAPLPASPRTVGTVTLGQARRHAGAMGTVTLGRAQSQPSPGSVQGELGVMLCPRGGGSQLDGCQGVQAHGCTHRFPSSLAVVEASWQVQGELSLVAQRLCLPWHWDEGKYCRDTSASPEDGNKLGCGPHALALPQVTSPQP